MDHRQAAVAWRTFNFNWLFVALLGLSLVCIGAGMGFSLEPVAFGGTLSIALLLAAIAYGCALTPQGSADPKIVFWLGSTAQVILVTAFAGPLSYVANAFNWPLQDQALLRIDRATGLDPQWIAAFVNDHSWLVRFMDIGYGFIKWPLLAIPIILTMALRLIRLQHFVMSLSIALVLTIVISSLIPAVGTYYGLGISPVEMFPLIDSSNYAMQLRDIVALRDGSLRQLDLYKLVGIVSFPSFHTASAILYIWALWPIRSLRWVTITVNIWMIASTPVVGAHYMIDIIGGIGIAVGSILLATRLAQFVISGGASAVGGKLAAGAALQYGSSR